MIILFCIEWENVNKTLFGHKNFNIKLIPIMFNLLYRKGCRGDDNIIILKNYNFDTISKNVSFKTKTFHASDQNLKQKCLLYI